MRVRFKEDNISQVPAQYRNYAGIDELVDNKEYIVYALYVDEISWYLVCSNSFSECNPNSFPWYLPAQMFEVIDSAFSSYWIYSRKEEKHGKKGHREVKKRGKITISAEHPAMADEGFYYRWVEEGNIYYMKSFLKAKKEMDAEDALRSVLLGIPKDNTQVVIIDRHDAMSKIYSDIASKFLCKDFTISSSDDLLSFLLNLDRYVHEQNVWFFLFNTTMGEKESLGLSEVFSTVEAYWEGHKDVICVSFCLIDENHPLSVQCF